MKKKKSTLISLHINLYKYTIFLMKFQKKSSISAGINENEILK